MELARFHPFADLIGLVVDGHDAQASTCSINVDARLLNPHRVVHGGVLYALADTGMGAALYPSLAEGQLCATIEIRIAYYRAVTAGRLVCRSTVVHRGKRTAHLESEIRNGEQVVAKASGSYSIFTPSAA